MNRVLFAILPGLLSSLAFADTCDITKLAAANNGFAFALLKQIAKDEPAQNSFISPLSVTTALHMLANGAAGKTKDEIQDVLNTQDFTPAELNADCKELSQALKSQADVVLDLADSIWYQTGLRLKPDFTGENERFFQAELAPVDFENRKSAEIINGWASKSTRGKIRGVVSFPFPPATRMVLANAIYFKGKWAEPFQKDQTLPRNFHLPDGSIRRVPMMSQSKKFSYEDKRSFQALRLPYAGDRLEMILFLPATNSSPEQLLEDFSGGNWNDKIPPEYPEREGTLIFPKFKLDYDVVLNDLLKALGMRLAFSPSEANFSAMADEPLFVSLVKQKSFVDVNEEGTEAAAVTTVTMTALAMEPERQPPFEMIVDRPFFFAIADRQTLTILFMGIINEPRS